MTNFRIFVFKLAAAFGLPWLFLIVWPAISYQGLGPVSYDKDKGDELDTAYWYPLAAPANTQGAKLYAAEGCVQCHSQMIRPPQVALDGWRKGWGQNQEARPAEPARGTTLRDYFGEKHSFLGITRGGPDLANVGYRFTNRTDVHMHLYTPQARNSWSNAPAYKHLYSVRKIQGQGAAAALPLKGTRFEPKRGFEVVPTAEAEVLVDYLMSLKRDYAKPLTHAVAAAPAKK
jgi:cytochrome c oxidase cbb3-type subunit 2